MFSYTNIFILLLYLYIILQVLKPHDIQNKLIITAVTYMIIRSLPEGFAVNEVVNTQELSKALKSGNARQVNAAVQDFQNKSKINTNRIGNKTTPPNTNMSAYDGLCLKNTGSEYWKHLPQEAPLLSNANLYTYFGSEGPLEVRLSNQDPLTGPPIDGVDGSPEKMAILSNNIASPLCCPSTFSTSTGCICTTKNQRDFINSRGSMDLINGSPEI